LWHYKTQDALGLKDAFEFIAPYLAGQKQWAQGGLRDDEDSILCAFQMTVNAEKKYATPSLKAAVKKLNKDYPDALTRPWY